MARAASPRRESLAAPRRPHPVDVPADAPSRAYAKIEEAIAWASLPIEAGQVALEIGAAPGGAVMALARRGLEVCGRRYRETRAAGDRAMPGVHHLAIKVGALRWEQLPRASTGCSSTSTSRRRSRFTKSRGSCRSSSRRCAARCSRSSSTTGRSCRAADARASGSRRSGFATCGCGTCRRIVARCAWRVIARSSRIALGRCGRRSRSCIARSKSSVVKRTPSGGGGSIWMNALSRMRSARSARARHRGASRRPCASSTATAASSARGETGMPLSSAVRNSHAASAARVMPHDGLVIAGDEQLEVAGFEIGECLALHRAARATCASAAPAAR